MTQPLPAPQFGDKYSTPLTDIGSGYAAGITSAGQSISGAIGAVMGGYNQRTGEVQPGILDQKKSSEDLLDMMYAHGMMNQDEYEKAKSSGLTAQQKWIGMATSEFNTKLQAQLDQKNRMAQIAATESGATGRTGIAGQTSRDVEQMRIQAEAAAAAKLAAARKTLVLPPAPTTTTAPAIPNKLNLNQGY